MGLLSAYLYIAVNSTWLWILILTFTLYWLYMRMWITFYDTNVDRTDDKVFIITGAESGVGKMTVDLLAARGGRIIMACKDMTLGQSAKEQISKRTSNKNLRVLHLDPCSLESVRSFSNEVHKLEDKLDVLIHGATLPCVPNTTSADGINTILQANHFASFLLTNLLLDLLKKSTPSRVVFVTTILHHFHKFSLDNINCDKEPLPGCRVYYNAKLANVMTAKYFARMLQGTGVTVNSVNPGLTQPTADIASSCSSSVIGMLFTLWLNIFGKTHTEAAMTSAFVATDPSAMYVTGEHYSNCKISRCVSPMALDRNLQEKLFEKSAQLVKLRPDEKHL